MQLIIEVQLFSYQILLVYMITFLMWRLFSWKLTKITKILEHK